MPTTAMMGFASRREMTFGLVEGGYIVGPEDEQAEVFGERVRTGRSAGRTRRVTILGTRPDSFERAGETLDMAIAGVSEWIGAEVS